jgi:HK97 gp10 family phage protein
MSSQVKIGINENDLKEITNIMKKLGDKLGKREINKAFRKGAKPLIRAALANAPISKKKTWYSMHNNVKKGNFEYKVKKHSAGELKKSIGSVVGRGYKPSIYIGPRGGRKSTSNFDAWYAHFVEYGTQGYTVKKDKKIPTPNGIILIKAGTKIPGQKPKAFMRKSWDMTKNKSYTIIKKELKNLVTKIITK